MPYITTKDGTRLYYEDRPAKGRENASGEDILVIHGLGSSHYDLADFIDDLNQTHLILSEAPHETAAAVERFIAATK